MRYKEEFGDIFQINTKKYVFAECIAEDLSMGTGTQYRFFKAHGIKYKRRCYDAIKEQYPDGAVGKTIRYKDEKRTIYNLITKDSSYKAVRIPKARHHCYRDVLNYDLYLQTITCCMKELRELMEANEERYLCITQIGCKSDKCKWEDVRNIIKLVFADSNIIILVCIDKKKEGKYVLDK